MGRVTGYESWAERQVREAIERGEFDNLPGAGRPIPGLNGRDDADWWVKGLLEREQLPMPLPTSLALRKEVIELPATLADVTDEADGPGHRRGAERADSPLAPASGRRPAGRGPYGRRRGDAGRVAEKPYALSNPSRNQGPGGRQPKSRLRYGSRSSHNFSASEGALRKALWGAAAIPLTLGLLMPTSASAIDDINTTKLRERGDRQRHPGARAGVAADRQRERRHPGVRHAGLRRFGGLRGGAAAAAPATR